MLSDSFRAEWSPRLLSVIRIIAGLMFMQHGLAKYFGFPAPFPVAVQAASLLGVAGVIEIVAGALIAVGLFARLAAFIASGEMAIAYFLAHWAIVTGSPHSFFPVLNGGAAAIMYCFVFLYYAASGPGPWALNQK